MASLFVIQGHDQGKRFELSDAVVRVGRDTSNPIQLCDTEVSRRHAEVHAGENEFTLVDLDSSNGTFVNNRRVAKHALTNGDRLLIGRTLMIFTRGEDASAVKMASQVDIVGTNAEESESRIVRSIRHEEGSAVLSGLGESESPWLARARSNLQIMYRTALAVSHTLDIDQLLHRIMELIFEWVETDRGCIMLVDPETDELQPMVQRNRKSGQAEKRMVISRTILDYVMDKGEGVLTSDARDDERWNSAASIVSLGVHEALSVPMQGRYGIVGVIYIDTFTAPGPLIQQPSNNKFTEEHLKLMIAIAHQAALAIEDTRYYGVVVQAERLAAMGQTIATLSHHIKNILQGIRGGSYLIEEGLKANETDVIQKGWDIVDKNQEKISNLVMDMLSFSKEREPDMSPNDLNQVVFDVVELMQSRASDMGVELKGKASRDMPILSFDNEGMHRAILNVVTNAIDACENQDGALVRAYTEYAPDESLAKIIIEDNGTGIAPEDVQKIFSVFESRKGSRGTGLGLPVSQKILKEHNGDIRVESQPDEGSRFVLELPVVLPPALNTDHTEPEKPLN